MVMSVIFSSIINDTSLTRNGSDSGAGQMPPGVHSNDISTSFTRLVWELFSAYAR